MKTCEIFINNNSIGNNINIADNFFTRLKGLMFKKELNTNDPRAIVENENLQWLFSCNKMRRY